jgi:hypothetical protein
VSQAPPLPPGLRLQDLLSVKDETDESGRLLLEDSAPKKGRRRVHQAGIAMKSVGYPHQDSPSRSGKLINQSAFEAVRHDMAQVLDGLAWLTSHYLARFPTRRSTVRLLFDVSHLGITLPLLLFHRARDPVPPYGRLPTFIASLFKVNRGVSSAAIDMLNRHGPPFRKTSAAEIVAFAEEAGHLRREHTERACAAPTRLIERTLSVLITGEGADAAASRLGEYVDFEQLWSFYTLQDGFSQAVSQFTFLLNDLAASGRFADPNQLFEARVTVGGGSRTFGEFTEGVLRRANDVQAGLNRVLERSDRVAPIGFEDLLGML